MCNISDKIVISITNAIEKWRAELIACGQTLAGIKKSKKSIFQRDYLATSIRYSDDTN